MLQSTLRFSTFLLFAFFVHAVQAAAPSPTEYPYSAGLNAGPLETQQIIEAKVDRDSLRLIREDFGNIQLLDDLNAEVPFTVYSQESGRVRSASSVELSAGREGFVSSNLLDDNRLTAFAFDDRIEADTPATILVDFGKLIELHRIEIWPTFDSDSKGMQFRAGINRDQLSTMKRRGEFEPITDGDYPPIRWLEISLWGTDIAIEDVNFYQQSDVWLYFTGEADRRYRLLYGDISMDNKRFAGRVAEEQPSDQEFTFAKGNFNPLAPEDFDGDGVANSEDNCPTVSNQSQTDQDGDRVGDPCDNALEVKNFSQLDVDRDGVGDLIDNCKLQPNPDQKDRDKDGFGDICDNAYAEESVFQKWTARTSSSGKDGGDIPYGFIGVVLAILAVAGIGITLSRKK